MKKWIITILFGFILGGISIPLVIQASSEHKHETPSFERPVINKNNGKSKLQKLIDNTEPGGTLFLEERVYRGSVSITKPITIIGTEETKIQSLTTAFNITDTENIVLENISIQAEDSAVLVNNSQNITFTNVQIEEAMVGIRVTSSEDINLLNVHVEGKEGHFSTKNHAVAIYNSKKVTITDSNMTNMMDGVYLESVDNIRLENNYVENGRYAMHLMYSDNIELRNNELINNMTGFMIMIANNVEIDGNIIAKNNTLNSLGVYVYDVESLEFVNNELRENTIAMDIQNARETVIKQNLFSTNGTVLQVKRSGELLVQNNEFYGNILSIRTDHQGVKLQRNYYDDYVGKDYDGDLIGDTNYIATNSFGQWMVRKPVYQYFIESPSVVTLNMLDTQVIDNATNVVIDEQPLILEKPFDININIHIGQLLFSSTLLIGMLAVRRRLK